MDLFTQVIKVPKLREWQAKVLPEILKRLTNPNKKLMLTISTGGGKTIAAGAVIAEYVLKGKKCLFVVDRLVLIQQTIDTLNNMGIACDILQGDNSTYTNAPVIVASQQTLVRRYFPNDVSLMVVDEAHILSKQMKQIIKDSKCEVLALSATPFTRGLGKVFNDLLNPVTMDELTTQGILVPLRVLECKKINMQGAKKIAGEYSDHDIEERALDIVGDVVNEYKNHANNKAIAFCATIKQCEGLAYEFSLHGIPAAVFCANTTALERKEIIRKYSETNEIMVLISVAALATGFDARNVMTIMDCRPLSKSLSSYIQAIGRGLRSYPGKKSCLLLDFTGNIENFLYSFEDFYSNGIHSLSEAEKKDKPIPDKIETKEPKGCPECKSKLWVRTGNSAKCLACGYFVENDIEEFESDKISYKVIEIDIFSAAKKGKTNDELWGQISNWVLLADSWGNSPDKVKAQKQAMAIYKDITGVWPKWKEILKPTKDKKINPEVFNLIRRSQDNYHKRLENKTWGVEVNV